MEFRPTLAHMDVSENSGTPIWMVKMMENPIFEWMIWRENPPFKETSISCPLFRGWVIPLCDPGINAHRPSANASAPVPCGAQSLMTDGKSHPICMYV